MKKITDYNELSALITAHFKRGVATNYFLSREQAEDDIKNGNLCACEIGSNLFVFRDKNTHFVMYYYIIPDEMCSSAAFPAPTKTAVVETVMRAKDENLKKADEILKKNGFESEFIRRRMTFAPFDNKALPTNPSLRLAKKSDFQAAKALLDESFSPLTGCLPSDCELEAAIADGRIVIHEDGGLLHFEKTKAGYELRHLCVVEGARGRGVGSALVGFYHSLIEKKSTVWVRKDYRAAEKIYENSGYEYDGNVSSVLIYRV